MNDLATSTLDLTPNRGHHGVTPEVLGYRRVVENRDFSFFHLTGWLRVRREGFAILGGITGNRPGD